MTATVLDFDGTARCGHCGSRDLLQTLGGSRCLPCGAIHPTVQEAPGVSA